MRPARQTTPESLEAMLISVRVQQSRLFADVRAIVVDEVHAFGSDDRGWHLLAVLERLSRIPRRPIQRIGRVFDVGVRDWGLCAARDAPAAELRAQVSDLTEARRHAGALQAARTELHGQPAATARFLAVFQLTIAADETGGP